MNVREIITEKILDEMDKGTVVWHKSWISLDMQNLKSKHAYKGINRLMLGGDSEIYYLTFNQIMALKGRVKKGAKARTVIFWKFIEAGKTEEEIEKIEAGEKVVARTVPILRYYKVFRLQDINGIERPKINTDNKETETIEQFLKRINVSVTKHGNAASYSPIDDQVSIPEIDKFKSSEYYYNALFHELVHATGHENRLNRFGDHHTRFGNEGYSKEELVAEIGCAMLSFHFGIDLIPHNSSYCKNWLKVLKNDRSMIITAASKAEKAVAYLLEKK